MDFDTPTRPTGVSRRNPRFRRGEKRPIQLTVDDFEVLTMVAHHRFLTSRHIQSLLPHRSGKKVVERLGVLYHAGYLDRPRAQLTYYATAGSAPMVYALGNRGAECVSNSGVRSSVDWTWKNRSVGREFIQHTLATADVVLGLSRGARERGYQFVDDGRVMKFKAKVADVDRALVCVPDAIFGLARESRKPAKYFFLEADRATMPVTRCDLDQTSIKRKFLGYLAGGGRDNTFGQQLGIDNFRVLIVTTSAERIASMLQALKDLTRGVGSRQFLFIEHAKLAAAGNALDVDWLSGRDEQVRLTD